MSASEEALEIQHQLLEDSLPLVFAAYDEAVARNVKDPVVFLLDCEDHLGGQIAASWLGAEVVSDAVEDRRAEGAADESTTVFAFAFPLKRCRREVPDVFPYLAPGLDETPPVQGFYAISVAAGGASLLTTPLSARPAGN